ncbi:MAG: DnaJ domain-containing protein [Clostridia bacterium]|nr:DnaJ domain-containing protein [Clostridia bacterium]
MNPYEVLGVSPQATPEEVKAAYRALARKYNPQGLVGEALTGFAAEKMEQINEAYDAIIFSASQNGGQNWKGSASWFERAQNLVTAGRYSEAEVVLDSVDSASRTAEWYYLKGCVCEGKGWYDDASRAYQNACRMDPSNREFQRASQDLHERTHQYSPYRKGSSAGGDSCSSCDICTGLMCADCMCECCGGDLISCC